MIDDGGETDLMLLLPTTATHTCNFSFDGGFIDLGLAEELFLKILCDKVAFSTKIKGD